MPCGLLAPNLFAGLTTTLELSSTGYRDPNSVGGKNFTAFVAGGNNYLGNYSSKAKTTATVNGSTQTGFETFCVEFNQTFNPNTAYNTVVNPEILSGGAPVPVKVGTAYLYSQFAQGTLQGWTGSSYINYNYTAGSGREMAADELQDAIWYLQGQISNGYEAKSSELYQFNAATDPFLLLVNKLFGSTVANESDLTYGNSFGVLVLNLTSQQNGSTVYNQDQLVYCPVPEPATLAAGAMLLLPLGWSAFRSLRDKKARA